jgi:N-terminal domain of oxidoreductase
MRTIYLSLDPYMRGRMNATKSYAAPVAIGQPMVGGTVGEIVKSRNPEYSVDDIVLGNGGWQEYALSDGAGLRKLDAKAAPVSTALGVLGMPGMTAYVGLLEIGQPKPGETVVVAAASGAVGSVVGQIAKIKGCHAIGTESPIGSSRRGRRLRSHSSPGSLWTSAIFLPGTITGSGCGRTTSSAYSPAGSTSWRCRSFADVHALLLDPANLLANELPPLHIAFDLVERIGRDRVTFGRAQVI